MSLPAELAEQFELLGELGRGAMGVVYRARDRSLGREVALKLLMPNHNERAIERLRREGELTARLSHPGVVTLHSAGVAGGFPYLAYELVTPARTLAAVLPSLDLPARLQILLKVSRALAHAHHRGVIHRDVKPENVLIDASGAPKVADFGLAAAQDLARLTQTGAMLGTPSFMAPEQLSMRSKSPVGPPADVWSLGVMLYEMLTDELPFAADSVMDLALKIAGSDPSPPNERVANLDPGAVAVCLKALRRDSSERYVDAGAFADDLLAVIEGRTPEALRKPNTKTLRVPALLGVAGLLVAIGAGTYLAVGKGSAPPEGEATEANQEASLPDAGQAGARGSTTLNAADAAAQLRKVLATSDPPKKLRAAWSLLRGRPPELQRTRALNLVKRLGREHPLRVLAHGERAEKARDVVKARFVGDDLITWAFRGVRRWRLPDGVGQSVPGPSQIQDLEASGGDVLIYAPNDQGSAVTRLGSTKSLSVPALERVEDLRQLTYTRKGEALAFLTKGPAPMVIDLKNGVVRRLDSKHGHPLRIAFSPDGKRLLSLHGVLNLVGLREGVAVLWDVSAPKLLTTHKTPVGCVQAAYSRDGKRIALGSASGHVLLYNDELEPLGRFKTPGASAGQILQGLGHSGHIRGLAFSKTGRWLFSCAKGILGVGHELRCWDVKSRELVWEVVDLKRFPESLAVSASGAYLAIGTSDGVCEVWIADPEAGL